MAWDSGAPSNANLLMTCELMVSVRAQEIFIKFLQPAPALDNPYLF